MDHLADVSDPSEFTEVSLQKLDSSLRCPICKDLFRNPVITPCTHSFCSICIRECLAAQEGEECPICRERVLDGQLKRNTTLSEVIQAYLIARPEILDSFKRVEVVPSSSPIAITPPRVKRKREGEDETRSVKPRRMDSSSSGVEMESPLKTSKPRSTARNNSANEGQQSIVECPLCQEFVENATINQHLDSNCKRFLVGSTSKARETKAQQKNAWSNMFSSTSRLKSGKTDPRDKEIPTKREPKVAYDLKSLKQLKEILSESGLSVEGTVQSLKARHEYWVNLWNSELDALKPRTIGELKIQLEQWEAVRNKDKGKEKIKVENATKYLEANKEQFKALTESARQSRMQKGATGLVEEVVL